MDESFHTWQTKELKRLQSVNASLVEALRMMVLAYETPHDLQSDYHNEYLKAKQALLNAKKGN